MTMTWSNASNKAACDARASRISAGYIDIYTAGFAVLLARVSAVTFGAATTATPSVATAGAITRDPSADASGDAAKFRLVAGDGTTVEASGDVTLTGGGGDLELVGTLTLAAGQPFEISSFAISQG